MTNEIGVPAHLFDFLAQSQTRDSLAHGDDFDHSIYGIEWTSNLANADAAKILDRSHMPSPTLTRIGFGVG